MASLSIGDIRISGPNGSHPWPFRSLADSLTYRTFQQTVPLTITPEMKTLTLTYRIRVWDFQPPSPVPTLPLYRIRVLDHATGLPLLHLHKLLLSNISGNSLILEDSVQVSLKPVQGKTVSLTLASIAEGFSHAGIKPVLINAKEYREQARGGASKIAATSETEPQTGLIPAEFKVYQNYPNPFNPTTTITYDLPEATPVSLVVYDVTGRRIRTLVQNQLSAGTHQAVWDGTDNSGRPVASGVYVYRLTAGSRQVQSRKMLLMK